MRLPRARGSAYFAAMTLPHRKFSRRFLLGGLLAGAAVPALADAPLRSLRPPARGSLPAEARRVASPTAEALIAEAQLGGRVCFAVADARSGRVLESAGADTPMPPASVAKSITAVYALDALGPDFRFSTRLVATGALRNGRLDGDLILVGAGDPTLDTDALATMASELQATGLREIGGRFLVDDGALPYVRAIDPGQPAHVSYNPAVCGLNLNFNRVHFEWRRAQNGYQLAMEARSERARPAVSVARMRVSDRRAPLFTYDERDGVESWTVAAPALGRQGSRWLPVRRPAAYAGEVFQVLARAQGITLPRPLQGRAAASGTVLVEHLSEDMTTILTGMMKWSTNLTAEAVGLTASARRGPMPTSLADSAARMETWLAGRTALQQAHFVDHSGLGAESRISAGEMVAMLAQAAPDGALQRLMKHIPMKDARGRPIRNSPTTVNAKTGTLNFVSGLAGYVEAPSNDAYAFAIFAANLERRQDLGPDDMERPEGGRGWTGRARGLQQKLIERWVSVYGS